jgi:hypothetical protein
VIRCKVADQLAPTSRRAEARKACIGLIRCRAAASRALLLGGRGSTIRFNPWAEPASPPTHLLGPLIEARIELYLLQQRYAEYRARPSE